jgi:hypothetical protein
MARCGDCRLLLSAVDRLDRTDDGDATGEHDEDAGERLVAYECPDCGVVTETFGPDLVNATYRSRAVYERLTGDGDPVEVEHGDHLVVPPDLYDRIHRAVYEDGPDREFWPGHDTVVEDVRLERGGE